MTVAYNRTFIAIDYGSRRIGLAKSDPTGTVASALTTLEVKSDREAIRELGEVIREHRPDRLVVGYPVLESGERSQKCGEVDQFVRKLETIFDGPIDKEDERYSSREAVSVVHAHGKKAGRDKKRIDRLAAVIILQRYLDEHPPT